MTSYLIGNLLGRALASYLMVLLAWFLIARFDIRRAFRQSLRWPSWLAVLLLVLLGMAGHVAGQGGLS